MDLKGALGSRSSAAVEEGCGRGTDARQKRSRKASIHRRFMKLLKMGEGLVYYLSIVDKGKGYLGPARER